MAYSKLCVFLLPYASSHHLMRMCTRPTWQTLLVLLNTTVVSVCAQPTALPATDFFGLAPLVTQNADAIMAALGQPNSIVDDADRTDFQRAKIRDLLQVGILAESIYTWSGIEVYFDENDDAVLWLIYRGYAPDRENHLFGRINFDDAGEDEVRETLGEPNRIHDAPEYPGIDWHYDDVGLRFHVMRRFENGSFTTTRQVVRAELIPQSFDASRIQERIANYLYPWYQLHSSVGEHKADLVSRIGYPQLIEEGEGFVGYQYPSFGFAFVIESSREEAMLLSLINEAAELPLFSPFTGVLPTPLHFSDTTQEMKAKLGLPDQETSNGTQTSYFYEEGVLITFSPKDQMASVNIFVNFSGFSN